VIIFIRQLKFKLQVYYIHLFSAIYKMFIVVIYIYINRYIPIGHDNGSYTYVPSYLYTLRMYIYILFFFIKYKASTTKIITRVISLHQIKQNRIYDIVVRLCI